MQTEFLSGPDRNITRFGESPKYREGLYRVEKNSYAWLVPNGSWGETNIGIIDCNGKSVLVDTCWDLKYTKELLQTAQSILEKSPVACVINTHADGDHCWGNQLFKDKRIIASHACIHQMRHMNPLSLKALRFGGQFLRRVPIMRIDRFGHYMRNMFAPYDFSGIHITDPNEAFTDKLEFTVNGVEIEVMEVGPGHTDGDIIVHVPSRRLVYAGDILFVGVTPVMWSGPVQNILKGLELLKRLDAETIVPGHGPLATDQIVDSMLNYWHFTHEQLHQRYQQSMTPLEAARSVLFSKTFQETEFARWDSPERLVTSAYSFYRHWGANLRSLPGPLGAMALMHKQASVAMDMPEATPRCMHRKNSTNHLKKAF